MGPENLMVMLTWSDIEVSMLVHDKQGNAHWILLDSWHPTVDHDWSSDKNKWSVMMEMETRLGLWDVENLLVKWVDPENILSD